MFACSAFILFVALAVALLMAEPRSVLTERLFPFWRQNLTFGSLALAGAVLLWCWRARLMAKHIAQLEAAVQRISAGDLSTPTIPDVRHRELARLQAAFVKMAGSLRETRGALDHQLEHERTMNETLQSLQRQVVRQERLTAVGLLASGVAHELNNPLQAILGAATLLERQEQLSSEARSEIDFVKAQSIRAREIIRSLARFSSSQSGPPSTILLRDVVSDILGLHTRDVEDTTLIEIEDTSSRPVYANFTELEQVTLNFVLNARQAVHEARSRGEKGRIQIRIFDHGYGVRLEVNDNGPGVPLENESKLFQPFFTTKPVGQGTGLGLSVSYGIVQSYGGTIGYLRNAWGGATFFFELPALSAQVRQEEPPEGARDAEALLRRPVRS